MPTHDRQPRSLHIDVGITSSRPSIDSSTRLLKMRSLPLPRLSPSRDDHFISHCHLDPRLCEERELGGF